MNNNILNPCLCNERLRERDENVNEILLLDDAQPERISTFGRSQSKSIILSIDVISRCSEHDE